MISLGDGSWLCNRCYAVLHPYKPKKTFLEVMCNEEDQVLVRQLLDRHVPLTIQCDIVRFFNDKMKKRNQDRVGGNEGDLQVAAKDKV